MKLLKDILYRSGMVELIGDTNIEIESITFDSRSVDRDSMFIAVPGTGTDGHLFIDKAIELGASVIVCQVLPDTISNDVVYVRVVDTQIALGIIACNFHDNPSEGLKLIGITGTNGKTTVASLLHEMFKKLDFRVGLISTIVNKIHDDEIPSTHTTPDPIQLNFLLRSMVEQGMDYCFMEVSSHAIHQHRIEGLVFEGAVFTNITQDHLDYHETFNEYIKAKKMFFDGLDSRAFALYNNDDVHGKIMVQNSKARKYSFGLKSIADYKAKILENQFDGLHLLIENKEVYVKLVGLFNVYNILTVFAVGDLLQQDQLEMLTAISTLESVEGRFQYQISDDNIIVIVDYAHTPDAIKNVLKTIKDIRTGNETVISVLGCGGDRDKDKRPKMAAIACELSDKVVLTSDNPRSEDPTLIIDDMMKGVEPIHFKKTLKIVDRREAIRAACSLAAPGDIVLIAGKGHEKYQEIKGERFPFDDKEVVSEMLNIQNS